MATGDLDRRQRAVGCLVGAAVGDALGAPFEFGPTGQWSKRFPRPVLTAPGEMTGGGSFGWAPGQFTDDTEMATIVAESLMAAGRIDPDDQLTRFRAWARDAADVGMLTRAVLDSGLSADRAATAAMRARDGRGTAGNGSIMRAAPGAICFAGQGHDATLLAAVALSAVTHADPLCRWGVALFHEIVRQLLDGGELGSAVDSALVALPPSMLDVYRPLLAPAWTPSDGGPGNGSVMGALAQAIWAVRRHPSFADAVAAVIDLGDDTDSVAAVTGALAGTRDGIDAIPTRWTGVVHGHVRQVDGTRRRYDLADLQRLALGLLAVGDVRPGT